MAKRYAQILRNTIPYIIEPSEYRSKYIPSYSNFDGFNKHRQPNKDKFLEYFRTPNKYRFPEFNHDDFGFAGTCEDVPEKFKSLHSRIEISVRLMDSMSLVDSINPVYYDYIKMIMNAIYWGKFEYVFNVDFFIKFAEFYTIHRDVEKTVKHSVRHYADNLLDVFNFQRMKTGEY